MILSMSGQAWLFLSTVLAGFVIGFVYDIFRILRKTVPHTNWLVQLEDVIYWIGCSLLMFYFMLHSNYGEIRFFAIAGAALGMVLYFCSLSKVVLHVSLTVIQFLQKVILTAARIILGPIRFLLKFFTRFLAPPARRLLGASRNNMRRMKSGTTVKLRGLRRNVFVMLKKI